MLNTLWSSRWYLILGLLAFLITLLLTMPLHFVWRYVEPQLQGLPVHVNQVSGSLWQAKMQLHIVPLPELGTLQGHWEIQPWALFVGKLKLQLDLESADLRLQLPLTVQQTQLQIEAGQGYLDLAPLQPIFAREHGRAEGSVELQNLNTTIALEPLQIKDISGQLTYSGGDIGILIDNKPVQASMPPLLGRLAKTAAQAQLTATTPEGLNLFDAFVKDDGWAGIVIKRNFIDVLGQAWPMKAEPDDVVFEVSRKVL